ncbi:SSS family solute:Na+ symporter [Sporomusaceae bacterium BoRhaA]|uniref:sodium:solute symporter family protein n=1 Tax=Pelorhabdus rhamnosifermentans TaxID=2772457 RepID=UPI001C061F42|nr:sodium:solute symporter family protein [Pelorhabdus rhamnosifermentans]MBU2700632.1 SSS family solute:Na+ symporter [Pelorhabdus rhamnosifermentans]
MNIPLLIVALYIIALFFIGLYGHRRTKGSTENYVLAGRRLTTPLITVSIVGLAIGGASTIGVAEQAYQVGLSAGWYTAAWAAGAITMGLLLAKKYRQLHISTIPELLGKYYDKKGVIAGVICQIFIQLIITSLQYIAGGSILHALLPNVFDFQTGMITSAIVFISVTFVGGMWSASLSNLLHIVLIYVGITLATIIQVGTSGGLTAMAQQLPADIPYFDWFQGVGWQQIVSWFAVMITVNLSLQSIVQISLGAKDTRTSRNGFLWGGLMMIPVGFLCALLGIAAKVQFPETTGALALTQTIMTLNPVLAGLTLAALWSADISAASNLLLSAATLFSQDVYKKSINPAVSEQKYLLITKLSVVIFGFMTFVLALTISGIIKTLMVALSLTASFSVIVLFTIYAPKMCSKSAAFYTIVAGVVTLILWQTVPQIRIFPHVIFLEWLVCLGTFVGVHVLEGKSAVALDTEESLG